MTLRISKALALIPVILLVACGPADPGTDNTAAPAEAVATEKLRAIARDAYIYGLPFVVGYKTLYNYAVDTNSPDYKGPFNEVACEARLFTPDDAAVVTPNADTPYCMFWLDLRAEPLVLTVPELEPERFYHFQLIDLYTHNYAYVGTLTTGNDAGRFLLAGPDWSGAAPEGIEQVLRSETSLVLIIVRTQLFGPDDLPRVEEIQQSYQLEPLSSFAGTTAPEAPPAIDFPPWVEGSQFDERGFEYIDFMLQLLGEPDPADRPMLERMASLELKEGGVFEVDQLPESTRAALAGGVQDGMADIQEFLKRYGHDPLASAKIFGTREFLQNSAQINYGLERLDLPRAAAAQTGLYGNSGTEAVYPTYLAMPGGKPYDATKSSYTLTFAADDLPPVKAFWSLTMYDGKTQLFVRNPLQRYLLNSTMEDDFVYNEDGSLTLYIGKDSPGAELEANWLPAPDGPFYMVLRLYGPEPEVLQGLWTPPQPVRVTD